MNSLDRIKVLGRLHDGEFAGRQAELDRLCELAKEPLSSNLLVAGAPLTGKTELLRETYDRLFNQTGQCVPIYYAANSASRRASRFPIDYLIQFLLQFIAFRQSNPKILRSTNCSLAAAAQMAAAQDYSWIRLIIESIRQAETSHDNEGLLRAVQTAPHIASSHSGLSLFIMLDDFHRLAADGHRTQSHQSDIRAEFATTLLTAGLEGGLGNEEQHRPLYALCGLRRPLLGMLPPKGEIFEHLQVMTVPPLAEGSLEQLISATASRLGLQVSDSARELMIQQLDGNLFYIRSILAAAADRGTALKSFIEFERLYTEELINGRLGHYFDSLIREAAIDPRDRRSVVEILAMVTGSESAVPIEMVTERIAAQNQSVENLLANLHDIELIDINLGSIRRSEDPVLSDYVRSRYCDEIAGWRRPIAGYQLLGEKLKASYGLMISRYNRAVAGQLVKMLLGFDFQSIPASLLNHRLFEDLYSGASRVQARESVDLESDRLRLPQIVSVSDLGSGEKSGVGWRLFNATGFEGGVYSDANEVVWIIALINSNTPVNADTLQIVDSRLRAAAENWRRERVLPGWSENRGASTERPLAPGPEARFVRWFVSKEGFAQGAVESLFGPAPFTSNYSNLDLILDYLLKIGRVEAATPAGREFELVIPIQAEAELIAAKTAEQIARKTDFDQESINQIKTALIEACLDTAERAAESDSSIRLHFTAADDRLTIVVSSKGTRFGELDDQAAALPGNTWRARGMQIIKTLMDDVRLERSDDGSALVMTKLLRRSED